MRDAYIFCFFSRPAYALGPAGFIPFTLNMFSASVIIRQLGASCIYGVGGVFICY